MVRKGAPLMKIPFTKAQWRKSAPMRHCNCDLTAPIADTACRCHVRFSVARVRSAGGQLPHKEPPGSASETTLPRKEGLEVVSHTKYVAVWPGVKKSFFDADIRGLQR